MGELWGVFNEDFGKSWSRDNGIALCFDDICMTYHCTSPVYKCCVILPVNTLRPKQNGRHFADDTFKRTFLNKNMWISIKISLEFVPKGPINNIPALVQIMAWRRLGDEPLSEPMLVRLPTHICVTRPQWVNEFLVLRGELGTNYLLEDVREPISFGKQEKIPVTSGSAGRVDISTMAISNVYSWYMYIYIYIFIFIKLAL